MRYLIITFIFIANFAYAEMPTSSVDSKATDVCKIQLAKLLSVDKDKINVKFVENTTWSDASLGFPKEGYSYAQVIIEGQRIILTYNKKDYECHTGTGHTGTGYEGYVKFDPKLKELLEQQK